MSDKNHDKMHMPHDTDDGANNEMFDDFEERYGSTEDFSKRAVGSLFDEEAKALPEKPESKIERPLRGKPDPDEEYAKYLQTSREDMRNRQRIKEIEKERALAQRERQLAEFSQDVSKRGGGESRATREGDVPAYAARPKKPQEHSLNLRNIAAIGLFVILIIFAILAWQLSAASGRLSDANTQIEQMDEEIVQLNEELLELRGYRVLSETLNAQVVGLQQENANLVAAQTQAPPVDDDGEDAALPNEVTPQQPAQPPAPAGGRTHTVQYGETLWGIAASILGNGARYAEILTYNNLPPNSVVQPGQVLRIPN